MTIPTILDILSRYLQEEVMNFLNEVPKNKELYRIEVYSGYPPVRVLSDPKVSCIACIADSFTDAQDEGTVSVLICFSIYCPEEQDTARMLYNIVERCRQALLRKRILDKRASLVLPLKGAFDINQPNTQFQAAIKANYSIANICFEAEDFDPYR